MTGALTYTDLGVFQPESAAFKTAVETVNVGAATLSAETTSLVICPLGNGQVRLGKIARAA